MSTLTPTLPRPLWMDRFALELGRRWPTIDPETASVHAGVEFHEAADLAPEEAAAIFASSGTPPLEDGAAG